MHKRIIYVSTQLLLIIVLHLTWGTISAYTFHSSSILGPSDHREAYFNGSSYIRLHTTISLLKQTGLSFRTCFGGELFSQQYKDNIISLSVSKNGLDLMIVTPEKRYITTLVYLLLDNRWHTVSLEYRLGSATLSVDGKSQSIFNTTYNTEILNNAGLSNEGAILIVGKQFTGCILEGPSLVFNASVIQPHNTIFGACPLPTNSCIPRLELITARPEDYCSNEPCMRHGICVSRADRYECHCTSRYSGNNCELDNGSPCKKQPPLCFNGATCIEDKQGDFKCACTSEFTGKQCETEIKIHPLCEPDPCLNNGTCKVSPGANSPSCVCVPGFNGPKCETEINECLSNPCENGGTCIDGVNNYTCYCGHTGYKGINCDVNINECVNNPCLNQGVCFDTYGSYTCQCQEGFDGQNCEQNLNECVSMPCQNRGVCIDKVGGFECKCPAGYSGAHCEISSCDGACAPYAKCIETPGGFKCICKPGYTGLYPNCTGGNSDCLNNPCENGGTCIAYMDSFNCSCTSGFAGRFCEKRSNCLSQPCRNRATCVEDVNTYRCLCRNGYTGRHCHRRIQCADRPCVNAIDCQDFTAGYLCTCAEGWTGSHCDISTDECYSEPCLNGATCITTLDHYHCFCATGYSGKTCQVNVDECASSPCLNGGTCIDKINGFSCNCTEDYMGPMCERLYDACELKPCQNNATCVTGQNKHDYTCECVPGFDGLMCENNIDECQFAVCPDGKVCIDLINNYDCKCPEGYMGENCSVLVDPCVKTNCQNGGTCLLLAGQKAMCKCKDGFTGKYCEEDIDECALPNAPICEHGLCVNQHGHYQCYCMPGYSGIHCELDYDECLSVPCKHGATCVNQVNNYECICTPGYTGKDCSVDINECDSSPCMEGSTCIDGIASYNCICQPGMTGQRCEINIDDCENAPCENGGQCIDSLNSYSCNCTDTGYYGLHCELNIDDCLNNPCINGAQCVDGIKDYTCKCYQGYSGKNCEIDINECESSPCQFNGTCLQRSNNSLYYPTGSNFDVSLPPIFSQEFSFVNASGYECICVPGVIGKDCEVNINECESSPCHEGSCIDKIGGYICECDEGFEGDHCEIDIDECLKYKPCVNGTCVDRRASYFCECYKGYGGKNCSVELEGCKDNPCLNNGMCNPYLENEILHKYNCSCPNGFHGQKCEKITTMSLSGSSYVTVNTSRDEGYDIQFRFKTTLGDGLLAIGKGLTFYILELVHGRLNLHSSILNKWEGVFIGSNLNDSNWQKVFVAINSSHLVLAANEEQTIYPININEGSNASHTSFQTTYLGGTISEYSRLTHGPSSFVGCAEDVVINGEWVLPQNTSWMSLVDVEIGCLRTPQCEPNPCHSSGRCTDKWRTFNCTCERPYLGHTCQYNYTAATFGHENISKSLVTVAVSDNARRAVRSIVDISMFIRTRQSTGQIFYIGSSPSNQNDDTYISAQLEGGELLVRILFNGTTESYTVGGVKLDNGNNHLIEVSRNVTLVQVKLNQTEYFRKTISATGQLDAQVLYLGGIPDILRTVRQTDNGNRMDTTTSSGSAAITSPSSVSFKGIIQDVQISNGNRSMVVEFFPLNVKDLEIPMSFGNVTFDEVTLQRGVVSDDSCATNPCEHNGTCTVTWNDFICKCPVGFKGKTCSELEFCQLKECPKKSVCKNLEDGYECIANTTFNGKSSPLAYNLTVIQRAEVQSVYESMEINYRTKYGGTILFVQHEDDYFFIFVHKNQVTVQWSFFGRNESYRFMKEDMENSWNTLLFIIKDHVLHGGFKELVDDDTPNILSNDFNTTSFTLLFMKGTVYLGGSDRRSFDFLTWHEKYERYNTTNDVSNVSVTEATIDIPINALPTEMPFKNKPLKDKYKGCLGEIRIGNILLPYFMTNEIYSSNYTAAEYFSLLPTVEPEVGCTLCYEEDCLNRGHCFDKESSYQCECAPGYTSEDCSVNIDECVDNKCQNNSTCVDGIANYTCICAPGYEGWLCNEEIDECRSNPCRNGGTCTDLLANYECACTEDYVGHQCEAHRLVTCENQPCSNGSTCVDGPNLKTHNNFTCICMKGMEGVLCDTPFCIKMPCKHGSCNISTGVPFCQCDRGYKGNYCEEDINDCILPTGDSPCQNNGICNDEVDTFTCNCTNSGYKGLICEIDVDECETEYICGPEGQCSNIPGSYVCTCPEGLCGEYCALQDPCITSPCVHGACVSICKHEPNYTCDCMEGFYGKYCNETMIAENANSNAVNIALIVVPIVAILLLAGAAGLAVLIAMARSKRATRGTYSPSAQEFCNPRVELDHVLKPPPEERLI